MIQASKDDHQIIGRLFNMGNHLIWINFHLNLCCICTASFPGLLQVCFYLPSGKANYTDITCLSTFSMCGNLLFLNDTNAFLLLCNCAWAQASHFLSKVTDPVPCLKQQPEWKRKHIIGGKLITLLWSALQWPIQHQYWGNILFFPRPSSDASLKVMQMKRINRI